MTKMHLSDYSEGRENNFDFLRFLFATMVILSHSYAFLYNGTLYGFDPLIRFSYSQAAFGGDAVDGFFLISGFLVTQSWQRSTTWSSFALKRVLRIVPGLIGVLAVCVFVVGPLAVADRSAYFHNPATYKYFDLLWTRDIGADDHLPGVFTKLPMSGMVNGSLWTIRYEMLSYALVALFGLCTFYKRPWSVLTILAGFWTLRSIGYANIHYFYKYTSLIQLETFFFMGASIYLYRSRIVHSPWWALASVAGIIVAGLLHCLLFFDPILLGYLVFYVAYSPKIRLHNFAKYGDFSYGLYLYAFPIQQLLTQYFRPYLHATTLFLYGFCVTLVVAIFSWKLIERPFMRLKPKSRNLPTNLIDSTTKPSSANISADDI